MRVPERTQLDSSYLQRKELEFRDQHGRDPDTRELSSFARMPVKKIGELRKAFRSVPSEAAAGEMGNGEEAAYLEEAMDYVHADADHLDRRILELRAGYGGAAVLPANQVGAMLGLSPSQLSRRAAVLGTKMHEAAQLLEAR